MKTTLSNSMRASLASGLRTRRTIPKCYPFTTSTDRRKPPLPFEVVPTCPPSTCSCAQTPPIPEKLPIDQVHPLNATMAAYAQQVVIATGRADWSSRIEDDGISESWGALGRGLKGLMGRGGKFSDPYNNVLITNSSFTPTADPSSHYASAFLFPAFKYVPRIPISSLPSATSDTSSGSNDLTAFVRATLLPLDLHPAHSTVLPTAERARLTRSPELLTNFEGVIDIKQSPTVLICGHGGRDMRCGIMGPAVHAEFKRVLRQKGFNVSDAEEKGTEKVVDAPDHANVGLISHIGGHKYAGNVIIYIPPGLMTKHSGSSTSGSPSSSGPSSTSPELQEKIVASAQNPLAGKGIWYGRMEPRHVEGIVEETILRGRVVADHFRGGVGMNGEIYRL